MKSSAFEIVLEIVGVAIIACAVMASISLISYNPADPSLNNYLTTAHQVSNKAGIIGAGIADTLTQSFGASAWILSLGGLYLGVTLCFRPRVGGMSIFTAGLVLLVAMASAGLGLHAPMDPIFTNIHGGGAMGKILSGILLKWFSYYGSWVMVITISIMAFLILTRMSFVAFTFRLLGAGIKVKDSGLAGGWAVWRWLSWARDRVERWLFKLPEDLDDNKVQAVEVFGEEAIAALEEESLLAREAYADEEEYGEPEPFEGEEPLIVDPLSVDPQMADVDNFPEMAPQLPPPVSTRKKKRSEEKAEEFHQEAFKFKGDGVEYAFPDLSLLDSTPNTAPKQSREELVKRSIILERKLQDFGIEGRVTQVLPGPVITVYEFEPAPGIKVSRIANLADDLAMSLRALSVRVLAPIPGKSVVGIEAPNPSREMVFLKELLASEEFEKPASPLTMALGKDVAGLPAMVDLAAVPHLLIAGSTGSGKSVGINAMICSILYKASPEDVKFIMIDPKMLELSIYEGIPHLIAPVVTNPKKASNALRWAVEEMERRYEKLSELGVRNVAGYNRYVEKELAKRRASGINPQKDDGLETEPLEKLPYIVVVIDELADLMMVASKDVEDSLARLAQMARASGIHLIVATQRPSVDVLTGLIKANFPARISYQVRTRVDSRTILDSMGADTLLGKGDMLYLPAGASKLVRIHGPFVSDEEIHRVVDFLKKQEKPVYDNNILEARDGTGDNGDNGSFGGEEMDENYDKAVELVARTRQASISMIQRRLRIGYNRAARIVEMMEAQGLVGPADGLKPREVFIKELDDVETIN